jgi:hypothetical protein
MNESLAALVRHRACGRCEFCQMPEGRSIIPCEIDHIIAGKHKGPTAPENLALSGYNSKDRVDLRQTLISAGLFSVNP